MSWDALGAIAELLGAIAVITSLLYLGTQIRAGNKQSKAQTFHLVASEQARLSDAITNVPENFAAWLKLHRGEKLSDEEYARVQFVIARIAQSFLAVEIGHENGQIGDDFYEDAKRQINTLLYGEHVSVVAYRYLQRDYPRMIKREMFTEVVERGKQVKDSESTTNRKSDDA